MKNYQFPSDGSVVILEDKVEEALPLIKLLSQKGIAATYYTGADTELPDKPMQKIRLAFVDIQLFGPSDSHSYAQNILRILNRIIPDNNGPYILIVWSKTGDINADTLELEAAASTRPPVKVLRLSKSTFFKSIAEESMREALVAEIDSALQARLTTDDLSAVKKVVNEFYQFRKTLQPKKNALKAIAKELLSGLEGVDILQLFSLWENCINKTSGRIVESFSLLHKPDEFWQSNLKSTMHRMAHTQLGKRIDSVGDDELIKNAIKTLNYIFLGALEDASFRDDDLLKMIKIDKNIASFSRKENGKKYEIRWIVKSGEYQLYVDDKVYPAGAGPKKKSKIYDLSQRGNDAPEKSHIKDIIDDYLSIEPDINSKLFIDFNGLGGEHPGLIYKKSVRSNKRKRILLKNYFNEASEIFQLKSDQTHIVGDPELKGFVFIELNVVPFCDHAQDKWIKDKIRLLPGIMYPQKYDKELRDRRGAFYKVTPLLKIEDECYQCVFDFRLLKSEDIPRRVPGRRKPWFKLRSEVLADILSRLSSHASRVGVSFIE